MEQRAGKMSALEHIEIHQDAILIAQEPQPVTQELETALASLRLSDRRPLSEIDVLTLQHHTIAYSQVKSSEQTQKANMTSLSRGAVGSDGSLPSPQLRSTPLRNHHHDRLQNISSPSPSPHNSTTHINRTRGKGVDTTPSSMNTANERNSCSTGESCSPLSKKLVAETSDCASTRKSGLQQGDISAFEQGQGDRYEDDATSTKPGHAASTPTRKMTAAMQSPVDRRTFSNKENWRPDLTPLRSSSTYDILEAAVVDAATPPNSQSRPQSATKSTFEHVETPRVVQSEELNASTQTVVHSPWKDAPAEPAIGEVELLHDAEVLSPAVVPHDMQSDAPETVIQQGAPSSASTTNAQDSALLPEVLKKKAPVVRTTKAAQARISLAHGPSTPQIPSWGRPRETSGTPKPSNLRQALHAARSVSGGSTSSMSSNSDDEAKKEVFIPHSKPRPMSMVFPAPPPRPQGVKPPTKSTFVLPGEVVAAKLKAAREEREKKEEVAKSFKARPVPAAIRAAPAVRETKTSRARVSLGGKDPNDIAHRRAQSVATFRPTSQVQNHSRPTSRLDRPTSRDSKNGSMLVKEITNTHRASSSLANISKPRSASPAVFGSKPAMSKGREVFTREIFANAAAEEEKRAKEAATKKARAEAAERSRQLSREWAEKKKQQELQQKRVAA